MMEGGWGVVGGPDVVLAFGLLAHGKVVGVPPGGSGW